MKFHVEERRKKRWVHIASFESQEYALWFIRELKNGNELQVVEMWPRRRIVDRYRDGMEIEPS